MNAHQEQVRLLESSQNYGRCTSSVIQQTTPLAHSAPAKSPRRVLSPKPQPCNASIPSTDTTHDLEGFSLHKGPAGSQTLWSPLPCRTPSGLLPLSLPFVDTGISFTSASRFPERRKKRHVRLHDTFRTPSKSSLEITIPKDIGRSEITMSETSRDEPAISFSLLRLSKTDFRTEVPIKLNLEEDIREGRKLILEDEERERLVGEEGFSGRIDATHAADLCGLEGYLQLPLQIGRAYLGESMVCYVSACNNSGYTLSFVEIAVEISTNRARALLFENRETPIAELKSDERRDFLIRYDVKDVGEHQIKCLTTFTTPKKERLSVNPIQR